MARQAICSGTQGYKTFLLMLGAMLAEKLCNTQQEQEENEPFLLVVPKHMNICLHMKLQRQLTCKFKWYVVEEIRFKARIYNLHEENFSRESDAYYFKEILFDFRQYQDEESVESHGITGSSRHWTMLEALHLHVVL